MPDRHPRARVEARAGRSRGDGVQGDAPAEDFVPAPFEHWRNGRLRVEPLVAYYEFGDINRAVEDSLSVRTVKAVLRIGPTELIMPR
ncbi:MAG: hypothetical protein EPO20_11590 [Betaproteobacteria bacterium]|nr:MAG: hypothetical protein EPO20_11590 [Betaproteobacteria bacterium]